MSRETGKRKPAFCSNCGQPASGKFCTGCGSALRGARCPHCGESLQRGARYCQNCSHRIGGGQGMGAILPWVAVAVAGVVVTIVAVVALTPSPTPPSALPTAFTSQGTTPGTPREQADVLFDRAMMAYETGDSSQAAFSGQMALGAYALLDELDADAHFHIGLLHQITGDHAAILARADSIDKLVPSHLFAPMLRHRVGVMTNSDSLMQTGYQEFLQRSEIEGSAQRWEYDVHDRLVDSFRSEATSGKR